jgi:hypothetical protein
MYPRNLILLVLYETKLACLWNLDVLRTFRSLINRIAVIRDPILRKLVCILLLQVTPFARISDGTIYQQERMEGKVRELRHADHYA